MKRSETATFTLQEASGDDAPAILELADASYVLILSISNHVTHFVNEIGIT